MGSFEQAAGKFEALIFRGALVAEDAGEEAHDGVGEDDGGDGAVAEDVVADRDFIVDEGFGDPVVDAFVVAAEDDKVAGAGCVILGDALLELPALGGHEDDLRIISAQVADGGKDRFRFHHHALATTVGDVVGAAVFVGGEFADVVDTDLDVA